MPETRVPDPTLMARLQLSVKGVDWAASLVKPYQHVAVDGEWTAHQHLFHLLIVERENYHVRTRRILEEERPTLDAMDDIAILAERYPAHRDQDIEELAEAFMAERAKTYEFFRSLAPEQWLRTGVWPDGREVDLAWVAETVLWHALDHFATLLDIHRELEPLQARRWLGAS